MTQWRAATPPDTSACLLWAWRSAPPSRTEPAGTIRLITEDITGGITDIIVHTQLLTGWEHATTRIQDDMEQDALHTVHTAVSDQQPHTTHPREDIPGRP